MKITVTNVENKEESAKEQLEIILKEAVEQYKKDGITIEDIKLEEVSHTFSFKAEGTDDYAVGSVEHDGVTEMYQVNFDLTDKEKEDNEGISFYSDEEREIIKGLKNNYKEILSVFDEDDLEFKEYESLGDMVLFRFDHVDGYEVVRVFQQQKGKKLDLLIQEYSIKPKE